MQERKLRGFPLYMLLLDRLISTTKRSLKLNFNKILLDVKHNQIFMI